MNATQMSPLTTRLRWGLLITDLAYAALLVVLTLWIFLRPPGVSLLLWALVCVPLLILWPGMRRRRHRSYTWLCFLMLAYFTKAVEGSLSSIAGWTDYSVLGLSIAIFISAMMTSRWLQRVQRAQSGSPDEQPTTPAPQDKERDLT